MSKIKETTDNIFSIPPTHELIFVNNATGEIIKNFLPRYNTGSKESCVNFRLTLNRLYPEYTIYIGILKNPITKE
jgi:hypothetical protein